jgi:hypothetical protein
MDRCQPHLLFGILSYWKVAGAAYMHLTILVEEMRPFCAGSIGRWAAAPCPLLYAAPTNWERSENLFNARSVRFSYFL